MEEYMLILKYRLKMKDALIPMEEMPLLVEERLGFIISAKTKRAFLCLLRVLLTELRILEPAFLTASTESSVPDSRTAPIL